MRKIYHRQDSESPRLFDPKNTSYQLGGVPVNLTDGYADLKLQGPSGFKKTLRLFGEPVIGDVDNDGDNDAAVLLAADTEDIDIMYYAALVINRDGAASTTELMYLGDRIAPQSISFQDGRFVYNIAIRKNGEALTVPPSIGKSVWIHYTKETGEIGEWVKDFEGESAH
jgi:hypothetical protein